MKLSLTAKQNIFGFFFSIYVAVVGVWIAGGMAAIHWMQLITWGEYALVCAGLLGGVGLFALWAYYGFYRHRPKYIDVYNVQLAPNLDTKITYSELKLMTQLQDLS